MWMQLQIPKIEDGNNFGVAVQVGNDWLFGDAVEQLSSHLTQRFNINRRKCLSCWPTHAPRSRASKPRFLSKILCLWSKSVILLIEYISNRLLLRSFMCSNVTSRLIVKTSSYNFTIITLRIKFLLPNDKFKNVAAVVKKIIIMSNFCNTNDMRNKQQRGRVKSQNL